MIFLYHIVFYQPFLNALVVLYNTLAFQDLGLAIVFLTVIIRIVLYPLFHKSVRHQTVMQRLQPKLQKIKETHRDSLEKQSRAMMEVYKEEQVSPFTGILLLIVQLPILIALSQISFQIVNPDIFKDLYSFVPAPAEFHTTLLGLINLKEHSIVMVVLAAIAQYIQGKMSLPPRRTGEALGTAERMGRQMVFIGPLITILIFWRLPAAIALYWFVTTLFSIAQQKAVNTQLSHGTDSNIREKTY